MRKFVVFTIFIFLPLVALGQFKNHTADMEFGDQLKSTNAQGVVGLLGLDPSRFHMSQSYTMSYTSFGDQGITQGLYLNTMSYQFQIPLKVSLQLGYMHQPFQGGKNNPAFTNSPFVAGAALQYKPSEKTLIHFEFSQRPYSTYRYMSPLRGYLPY